MLQIKLILGIKMSIKIIHIFTITLSIMITAYYSFFEFTTPSNPGIFSTSSGIGSLIISVGLIFYMISIFKKFKTI